MKLYVSSDQEGVSGIATRSRDNWDQAENKRLQTEEMVALCNAMLEYDPKIKIVVNDSHGKGLNLDFEKLPEPVDMIRQSPEILDQMYGIDESYDGFMFFAHAMRGVLGATLSHVWEVQHVKINGKSLGEAGLAAYYAAHFGVPFVYASGDDAYFREVKELSPTTEGQRTESNNRGGYCQVWYGSICRTKQASKGGEENHRSRRQKGVKAPGGWRNSSG